MTHDFTHSIFFGTGAIYFAATTFYAFKNYSRTRHDEYWFFMLLFSLSMVGLMFSGTLWSAGVLIEERIHPYYDMFFLISSIFLFSSAYTLSRKHHDIMSY